MSHEPREISNQDDIIDSRDIIEAIESIRDAIHADLEDAGLDPSDYPLETAEEARQNPPTEIISDDEVWDAFVNLLALQFDAEDAPDWSHGAILIRDTYFEDYARELAEDIGAINPSVTHGWPFDYIDWEAAADALKIDYFHVDFDGVTYWIRS